MNLSLYVPGDGPLHRLPAGTKLAALLVLGVALFFLASPVALGVAALLAAGALALTGATPRQLAGQLSGIALILAIIVVANGLLVSWEQAAVVGLRIAALVFLAFAVTLTTRSSDVLDVLERVLAPLERRGLAHAGKVALAVSLVLRFVPEILKQVADIREARAARGLKVGPIALVVPTVVRTLRSADAIAEAIDARSYPPSPARPEESRHEHP